VNSLHVLFFSCFNRDKGHAGSSRSFGNGACIVVIVFVATQVWFYMLRWNQLHVMAHDPQFASPVMGAYTSFHANPTRWQLGKELKDLMTPEHTFFDLFKLFVKAYNVKDTFCQVQADGGNIHLVSPRFLLMESCFLHSGALTPFSEAGGDHLINRLLAL
jgi:hypothetical protein